MGIFWGNKSFKMALVLTSTLTSTLTFTNSFIVEECCEGMINDCWGISSDMINGCWGIFSGYDQWSNYKFNIDSLKPLYFWGARDKTSWGQDRNIFTEINTWEIF